MVSKCLYSKAFSQGLSCECLIGDGISEDFIVQSGNGSLVKLTLNGRGFNEGGFSDNSGEGGRDWEGK